MAIEKNKVKAAASSRVDAEPSVDSRSRDTMSTDDDHVDVDVDADPRRFRHSLDTEDDDDDDFDDADSAAGSDDFDLLELGETGSEFCQVGDQTCCIPFELYDLPHLRSVLSLDVWNECLTHDERFFLAKYLPDMDQDVFMRTLKELFEGGNLHFGNPVDTLYQMLKGGLCEPRVALYRQGLNFIQLHQHYHLLHKRHDSMVAGLLHMREVWHSCKGYGIEEKLRVLNIVRSQKSLIGETNENVGSEESAEVTWDTRSKGRGLLQGVVRDPSYGSNPALDVLPRGRGAAADTARGRKPNSKSLLLNEVPLRFRSGPKSMKTGLYGPESVMSAYNIVSGSGDGEHKRMNEMASQRDWNVAYGNMMDRVQAVKRGKNRVETRGGEYDIDTYSTPQQSAKTKFSGHGRNLNINQLSDIKVLTAKPSNVRGVYDLTKRSKYGEPSYEDQMELGKGRAAQMAMKGNMGGYADVTEPYWTKQTQRQANFMDPSFYYLDKDGQTRKTNLGKEAPNSRLKTLQGMGNSMSDRQYLPEKQSKVFQDNVRGVIVRNEGPSMFPLKSKRMSNGGEDTESDSSGELEEGDKSHLIIPNRSLQASLETPRSYLSGSMEGKRANVSVKVNALPFDGMLPATGTMGDFGAHVQSQEINNYYLKSRQSAKTLHLDASQNFKSRSPVNRDFGDLGNATTERNRMSAYIIGNNGQVQGLPVPMNSAFPFDRRLKENAGYETLSRRSRHMQDYSMEQNGYSLEGSPIRRGNRGSDATLMGCTSTVKRRKEGLAEMDEQLQYDLMQSHEPVFESISLKNRGKKRKIDSGSPAAGSSQHHVEEVPVEELEPEVKPPKKPSPLITPTVHTGFSFSVIHLLSAVRVSLITPNPQKHPENLAAGQEDQNAKNEQSNGSVEKIDVNSPAQPEQAGTPSLTVHDIVDSVRSNPGDPKILETQEPLQDLVRGVLKVFSSKTAPLGAKAWKPLISYDKSTKRWSWIGPNQQQTPTDNEPPEEVTSPEAWGIPRKMLVKLVDAFANWLKSGQETLQQIGSLPAPPAELMQLNFDEKERFKDLRAQKSLPTFSPSSDDVRSYFRKEERLRYSVPDRAFSYTAADGKKSIVAPLRRCGGKPTSKARDHFMLKPDRPPHVTILCLVRDAAARLPGSIGTRADVCTLIRDSQYVVEDVSDAQVNQVVSGALDRLHYERDPCVQFDGERKLWVYLHRVREEEDFEDDGTSSTKKWKRQKKDASEQDDQVTVACAEGVEPASLDPSPDLNAEPQCIKDDKVVEQMNDDTKAILEDGAKVSDMPEQGALLESGSHILDNSRNDGFQ